MIFLATVELITQACSLDRLLCWQITPKKRKKVNDDFSLQPTIGKYNIMMIDRQGQLLYSKPNNDSIMVISPELAVRNNKLISQFDPIQACYIGLLAGIKHAEILRR